MKKHLFRFLLATCLLAFFLGGGILTSPKAHAGVNGQQLAISTGAGSIKVDGYNQNNQHIIQCFDVVFAYPPQSDGYSYISGWWWKGLIYINYYGDTSCSTTTLARDSVYCQVVALDWVWHTGPV